MVQPWVSDVIHFLFTAQKIRAISLFKDLALVAGVKCSNQVSGESFPTD